MTEARPAPFSNATPLTALFCGALLFSAVLMHRLLGMATPVALNLFALAFIGAGLAVITGLYALVHVWRHGSGGAGYATIGILIAVGMLGWPLSYLPAYLQQPLINDLATDTADPPMFIKLAALRETAGSGTAFDRLRFESVPAETFSDIKPLLIRRPPEETYDIVLDAIKRMRLEIINDDPPAARKAGLIEAVDRTMVIGFYDDLVVRVTGTGGQSRIDVRSASRYSQHDFGRNASRMRKMLAELKSRIDATVPGTGGRRLVGGRLDKRLAIAKRLKDEKKKSAGRRNERDRGKSDARRAPGQKGTPR